MTTVHFVHGAHAYLPELAAYAEHLQTLGHAVQMHTQAQTVPDDAAAVWWLCGRVPSGQAQRLAAAMHVHEYASASVAPLAWLKDRAKQWGQPVPDFRVFQSDWVRQRLGFRDAVPWALRDMGVPAHFLTAQVQQPPEFDLVYLGEMSRLQHFVPLLRTLGQAGLSLLLVGDVPDALQKVLQAALTGPGRLHATGRVPQTEVPQHLLRARCGLNLMPDVLPLNEQTSTKMLEYLAVGLPVISNPYAWARRAAQAHADRVQFVSAQAPTALWQQALRQLPAVQADRRHLQALSWPHRLQGLPVWPLLLGGQP